MAKKVLVIGEVRDGELRNVSYEAIAAGKKVADGGEVVGVLLGENVSGLADSLIQYGADRVVIVNHTDLKSYTTDAYQQALLQVFDVENPEGVILGHTAMGKDVSPRLAMKLNAGLISDAIAIDVVGGEPVFTRPIYSGKAFEKKKVNEGVVLATIRPNNIPALEQDSERSGDVSSVTVDIKDLRTTIRDVVRKATGGVDLSEANVIVAGGRGVKSQEGFKPLQELADLLGGAVGASRGACDAEYCDYGLQIGQTGKVVTPDLYFAVGISGAIQHLAGMSNSKVIVAINKDPEAPIFEVADYGIVGDLFEIVPILTEELKSALISN
ncbi:electron transfer flavoprotein subunit alpha/FixB family protein [Alkalihalobacillus deserti]|uniref:electron transfer flavoprotein subunit alpha/FixB family protein n=1 Tax=Alkalihalobacillus deserti TaxID=2879466 RepID=UPI001D151008|nr:electron transfer flavoprotein subunit alpha/FixB family protein [Alkalihalobacillus deserti]